MANTQKPWNLVFGVVAALLLVAGGRAAGKDLGGPVAVLGFYDRDADAPMVVDFISESIDLLKLAPDLTLLSSGEALSRLSDGGRERDDPAELDRLSGIFQQGYLQSYSFEYDKAEASFREILAGLETLAASTARWDLFIRTHIFLGVTFIGKKDLEGAVNTFCEVLRSRPDMKLSRAQYSPKTVAAWEKARQKLLKLKRGRISVDSEPAGASVLIDGVEIGKTPFKGELYQGRYHLPVLHPEAGGTSRRIEIGEAPTKLGLPLKFEGTMDLGRIHPLVRATAETSALPADWCAWLRLKLGVGTLIVLKRTVDAGRVLLGASLVDLERGRKIREGVIEQRSNQPTDLERDTKALMDFLITGQPSERLLVSKAAEPEAEGNQSAPAAKDLAKTRDNKEVADQPGPAVAGSGAPWYRRWWPYAIGGGALLGIGVGAHLTSAYFDRKVNEAATVVDKKNFEQSRGTWRTLAITGYVLAAGAVVTGIVLDLTYNSESQGSGLRTALVPIVAPGFSGLGLTAAF